MKILRNRPQDNQHGLRRILRSVPIFVTLAALPVQILGAQSTDQKSLSQQVQELTDAMARTQARLERSQHELDEMRAQLASLQQQMAQRGSTVLGASATSAASPPSASANTSTASAIEDIRERQTMQESQIATQEQTKVESESKYPVKITGLLLLNGFINTNAVDVAETPTFALPGSGSTGADVRQTVLGLDARGPHLFGARSYADLRVDFDGTPESNSTTQNYSGYYNANTTLLRLRTAHAGLQWNNTSAYFSLDRPLISPDAPTSLTAVAVSPLAWSGNLWTWNPQLDVTQDVNVGGSRDLRLQAALIDVGDAPLTPVIPSGPSTVTTPSSAEESRWPGVETRVAFLDSKSDKDTSQIGVGGYFAPHHTSVGYSFDSWAGTLDFQLLLPANLQWVGTFYRGQGLGGLGGGAYKDFLYAYDPDSGEFYYRPLDDTGGWTQLKKKLNERLEFNAAFGMDDAFANELRRYSTASSTMVQNLSRNRTFTGNVIYSPSAYLLFSLEYRHLESSPVLGVPAGSNIIGVGAGYKF
jgi:hypothetical protein